MKRIAASALAVAFAAGVTNAQALSNDQASRVVHGGDGSGDLVLALVAGNDSLVWDLSGTIGGANNDLTFNDIVALSDAGASFSISNAEVSAFLTPERAAIAKWQVFGVVNIGTIGDFVNTGDMPTNVGFALTIDGDVNPVSGGDLGIQLQDNAQWLEDNDVVRQIAGQPENGVIFATAGTPTAFYSSISTHGEIIAMQDATADGVDIALAFYHLQKDPSRPNDPTLTDVINDPTAFGSNAMPALVRQLGSWRLAADGTLSFTSVQPVPVPAAAWMLGSGLLALAATTRRRRGTVR